MTAGQRKVMEWRSRLKKSVQVRGCGNHRALQPVSGSSACCSKGCNDQARACGGAGGDDGDLDQDEDGDDADAENVHPSALITSSEELEALAEELGATHPHLEGMARRIFDSAGPSDTCVGGTSGDSAGVSSSTSDPWVVRDLDIESNLVDHMLSMFSQQAPFDPNAFRTMPKNPYSLKDCGKPHLACLIQPTPLARADLFVTLVLPAAASLYQTEVTGLIKPTIHGKMAQKGCSDEAIDALMSQGMTCGCKTQCFYKWKEVLGNKARAIIKTERYAYGAMTVEARFHHYAPLLKSNLHMTTALASNGDGVISTGAWRTASCSMESPRRPQ